MGLPRPSDTKFQIPAAGLPLPDRLGVEDDPMIWMLLLACDGALFDFDGIAQTVPPTGSTGIPTTMPVIIFADDVYDNVEMTATATVGDVVTDLTDSLVVSSFESGAFNDIYVVSSLKGWPVTAEVEVTLTGDIEREVTFTVDSEPLANPDDLAFETVQNALPVGWAGLGDVGVLPETGSLKPSEGDQLLALSTGDVVAGEAMAGTSSFAVTGLIPLLDATTLTFDYNFQSAEFDDFCGSSFDDTAVLVAIGETSANAELIDSVNIVCDETRQSEASFPGQPDAGDDVYKETGTRPHTFDVSDLGPAISLTVVVTDVGDTQFTSVLGLDNFVLE
jgi:hypothetical protein